MRSSEEDDHERQYHRKQPTTISFAKFYERADLETISPDRSSAAPRQFKRAAYCRGSRAHFFAHGFRSVTMDDLATELGMSKKTLYAEFPSKTALLRAVLLDKFASVEKDLDAVMARCSGDAMAELQQLLACMQRQTEEIQPPFV